MPEKKQYNVAITETEDGHGYEYRITCNDEEVAVGYSPSLQTVFENARTFIYEWRELQET